MDYVNLTFILVSTITSKVIQNTSFNVPHFLHIACMCILLLNTPLIFFIFPNARWWYLKEKKRDTTNNTSKFRCEECWKDQLIAEMRRKMLELYCCVINFMLVFLHVPSFCYGIWLQDALFVPPSYHVWLCYFRWMMAKNCSNSVVRLKQRFNFLDPNHRRVNFEYCQWMKDWKVGNHNS